MGQALRIAAYGAILVAIAAASYGGISILYAVVNGPPASTRLAATEAQPASPAKPAVAVAEPAKPVARPGLCMSDAELGDFLKFAALGPITFGASKCSERFADLKDEAASDVAALTGRHGEMLAKIEAASRSAFDRSFGGDGVKRRDVQLDGDHKSTFQRILAYSRDECKSHIAAIESFGHATDAAFDGVLGTIARQSFEVRRAAIPACEPK